jgi:hypothetical protein
MVRYIDGHKDRFGVEPICTMLPIAPSTYYEQKARERDPVGLRGVVRGKKFKTTMRMSWRIDGRTA